MNAPAQGGGLKPENVDAWLSLADARAAETLSLYVSNRLPSERKKAASWVAAITAITGVAATAVILKGKATFTDLTGGYFLTVLICSVLTAVSLACAIFFAYSAAYGEDEGLDTLATSLKKNGVEPGGLQPALVMAVDKDVSAVKTKLRNAMIATLIALAALLVGSFVAAAAPVDKESPFCAKDKTTTVTSTKKELPGVSSEVTSTTTCT